MELNLVELIANVGGTLGLAIFVIVVLQRTWKDRAEEERAARERDREDRQRLLQVVERNTESWSAATQTMAAIADCASQNTDDLRSLRVLLARRPCVGTGALPTVKED